MCLQWKPDAKRPVGRPRKRWMEGINTAIERRGRSLTDVEEDRNYEDRNNCRRFLKHIIISDQTPLIIPTTNYTCSKTILIMYDNL